MDTPEENTVPTVCKRCGHTDGKALQPKEEELKQYLRSILGNKPFTKRFELFDGNFKILFSTITTTESARMAIIIEDIPATSQMQFNTEIVKIKLLYYLRSLNDTEFEIPGESVDSYEKCILAFEERFGDMNEDMVALVIRVYNEFLTLVTALGQKGFDTNFWKGAGLA